MKYKVTKKQHNSLRCFICGEENSAGLHANFYELENKKVACLFTAGEQHEGHPGILHGGVISAILDETLGRVLLVDREPMPLYTIELTVKFLKTVPSQVPLQALGWLLGSEGRLHEVTGEIYLEDGQVAASAVAKYLEVSPAKTHESSSYHEVVPAEDDIKEIEF